MVLTKHSNAEHAFLCHRFGFSQHKVRIQKAIFSTLSMIKQCLFVLLYKCHVILSTGLTYVAVLLEYFSSLPTITVVPLVGTKSEAPIMSRSSNPTPPFICKFSFVQGFITMNTTIVIVFVNININIAIPRTVAHLGRSHISSGLASRCPGELTITMITNAIRPKTYSYKVPWADARAWCSSRGMNLIGLETLPKADHFLNLVSTVIVIKYLLVQSANKLILDRLGVSRAIYVNSA